MSRRWLVGAVVVAMLTVGVATLLRPTTARQITIVNATQFDLAVAVASGDTKGWTPLTTVAAGTSDSVEEVADQGSEWTFRFRSADVTGGTLKLSRGELRTSSWTVEAPASIGARLKSAGVPAAPQAQRS